MTIMTISYGTYVFPVSPTLAIERAELDAASGGGIREIWRVEGVVRGANPEELEAARAAAEAAFAVEGVALRLNRGEVVVRENLPVNARIAPRVTMLRWDASSRTAFHGESRFDATFEAVLQENDATIQHSHIRVTQSEDIAGRVALTTEGLASLRNDVANEAAIAALTPALADGMRRVERSYAFLPEHRVEFRVVDEAEFRPLPGGVRDGHYTRATTRDAEGRPIVTLAGFFVGESALARVYELRPSHKRLIDEEVSENPFERRVDFRFVAYGDSREGRVLRSLEQVTLIEKRAFVDHKPKLAGAPIYRQETGAPDVRVIQEGAAVGFGTHPTPAAPLFPADVIEREVRYSLPDVDRPQAPLETRWRYVAAPLETVSFHAPM